MEKKTVVSIQCINSIHRKNQNILESKAVTAKEEKGKVRILMKGKNSERPAGGNGGLVQPNGEPNSGPDVK